MSDSKRNMIEKLLAKARNTKKRGTTLTNDHDLSIIDLGVRLRDDLLQGVLNRDFTAIKQSLTFYKITVTDESTTQHERQNCKNFHYHALVSAAEKGFQDVIEMFLEYGIDIDGQNQEGDTVLIAAAKHGHVKLVLFLLTKKANPNISNLYGCSALEYAAKNGHIAIVQSLLAMKADANHKNTSGSTPIFWAAKNGDLISIKALLRAGADVMIEDEMCRNAPMMAILNNQLEALELFLKSPGFQVEKPNSVGDTLLMISTYCNNFAAFDCLLKAGADCRHQNMLNVLIHQSSNHFLQRLLETKKIDAQTMGDNKGNTMLLMAASSGNTEFLKMLVELDNTKIDLPNRKGATALMIAAQCGHLDAVNLLLDHGADFNAKSHRSESALMAAVIAEQTAVVERLLQYKTINLEVCDNSEEGRNALMWAIYRGNSACVELLLKAGADAKILCDDCTPLMLAAIHGHAAIVEILLKTQKDSLNVQNKAGMTALIYASHGYTDTVRILLKAGADPNIASQDGFTPLMVAAYKNHPDVMKLLVQAKASLEATTIEGGTALMYACFQNHEACVRVLLAAGVKDIKDTLGQTGLSIAYKSQHHSILKMLLTPERVAEIFKNKEDETMLQMAKDAKTVELLQSLGFSGKPIACQMQVAIKLMGLGVADNIVSFLDVVDVNQPIQSDHPFLQDLLTTPLFLYANYSELEVRFIILKHKLYKSSIVNKAKINSFVDALEKTIVDLTFSKDGALCITLEKEGNPYQLTLYPQSVENILARSKITPLKSILWESSAESFELREEEEIRNLKDSCFSMLTKLLNQFEGDQRTLAKITEAKRQEQSDIDLETISSLRQSCFSHKEYFLNVRAELSKRSFVEMYDKKSINEFIDKLKLANANYNTQISEPIAQLKQRVLMAESPTQCNNRHKTSKRRDKKKRIQEENKRRDEIENMVPKSLSSVPSLIFSTKVATPKRAESAKPMEMESRIQLSPKHLSPKQSEVTLQLSALDIEQQRKQLLCQKTKVHPKALPSYPSKEIAIISKEFSSSTQDNSIDLRSYMKIPRFTFESATHINSHLKAVEGRNTLRNVAQSLEGTAMGVELIIETNAALGALAQALDTRKGLLEEWPNQVRNVIFRYEEAVRKCHDESTLVNIVQAISKKLDAITESYLMKSKGLLPLQEVDSKDFLKSMSTLEIPGFDEARSKKFIQQSEQELEQFKTVILKEGKSAMTNQKLKMAVGFSLARIGTYLNELNTHTAKDIPQSSSQYSLQGSISSIRSQYQKFIPLGRQYRHHDQAWVKCVDSFMLKCLNASLTSQLSVERRDDQIPDAMKQLLSTNLSNGFMPVFQQFLQQCVSPEQGDINSLVFSQIRKSKN